VSRIRAVLGLVGGVMLVASSGAHSLLGWPQLEKSLLQQNVAADLVQGLEIGWHFGGVSMLVFGVIAIWLFSEVLRGRDTSLRAPLLTGLAFVAFGCWALGVSDINPFFIVFIVPGLLLLAASWRTAGARA
jgi:hypothetical protein